MADIAASDVTYAMVKERKKGDSRAHNLVRLTYGDGALTIPAGGIPLTKGKLGCPTTVESLVVVDQGTNGYVFQYDQSTERLVVMYGDYDPAAAGPLVAATGVTPASTVLEVEVIGW